MDGLVLDPHCFHVTSFVGLRTSRPFESIHSWNELAHEEVVEWGSDHLGEWELKSPRKSVGMVLSRVCENMCVSACPD